MSALTELLVPYGEGLLFAFVLAEQGGLPLPSAVILLGAGAMVGQGLLYAPAVLGLTVLAALIPNYLWYRAGRRHGHRILALLCRISLDPDQCVRMSERLVGRLGAGGLLIGKFVPGLATLVAPLAGVLRMPQGRFWLYNTSGTLLWAGTLLGLGYALSDQIEAIAEPLASWGLTAGLVLAGLVALWIAFKLVRRQLLLRRLRGARITPEELSRLLAAGEPLLVVDLRHPLHRRSVPHAIPGALPIDPADLLARHGEIARDRDVILYCS